jgi:hypothetical protein
MPQQQQHPALRRLQLAMLRGCFVLQGGLLVHPWLLLVLLAQQLVVVGLACLLLLVMALPASRQPLASEAQPLLLLLLLLLGPPALRCLLLHRLAQVGPELRLAGRQVVLAGAGQALQVQGCPCQLLLLLQVRHLAGLLRTALQAVWMP